MSAILGAVGVRRPSGMRKAPPGGRLGGALRGVGRLGRGGRMRGMRRHRRGRGISAAGIRAARKLLNLLRDFQMALPRSHGRVRSRRRSFFSRRRRGDPALFEFEDEGD